MKRLLSMIMVVVLMLSTLSISAFAAEIPMERLVAENAASARATEVYDLGTNGSIKLVSTTCEPDVVMRSHYNYTTNSTEINVKLKSNISVSMRITLRDAATKTMIQQETKTLTTSTKTVTFDGLKSTQTYYVTFENLGQQTVNIEGSITA